jgi:hypothetical protein
LTGRQVFYNLSGVVRHQGLPVAAINVYLHDFKPSAFTGLMDGHFDRELDVQRTDTGGAFNFSVPSGKFALQIQPGSDTRFLRQTVDVTVGTANESVAVNLATGVQVSGSVRTKYGAAGLSDGEIVALGFEPSNYRVFSLLFNEDRYALILPKAKYHVAFRCPNGSDSRAFLATEVAIVEVTTDGTYDLMLSEFIKLKGEVKDPAGSPVENACVTLTPSYADSRERLLARELGLTASCYTNGDGQFQIDVQKGHYDINIEPDKSGLLFGLQVNDAQLTLSSSRLFQLSGAHKLHGRVVHEEKSLPDCLVRVQGVGQKVDMMTRTDANGEFSVGVPSGTYELIVTAHPKDAPTVNVDGADFAAMAPWSQTISIENDTHVPIDLQQGTAIYGRVSDGLGKGKSGVEVAIYAPPNGDERLDDSICYGITDSDGRYCLFVSPGEYRIAVHGDLHGAKPIAINDDHVRVDVIWPGWCRVVWEVLGADGKPIPRCRVWYKPYGSSGELEILKEPERSTSSSGLAVSNEQGKCYVTLPAGIYSVDFEPAPGSSFGGKRIKQLSINGDVTKSVQLPLRAETPSD